MNPRDARLTPGSAFPLEQNGRSKTTRTWWSPCWPGRETARTRSSSRNGREKTRCSRTHRWVGCGGTKRLKGRRLKGFGQPSALCSTSAELLSVEEGQENSERHKRQRQGAAHPGETLTLRFPRWDLVPETPPPLMPLFLCAAGELLRLLHHRARPGGGAAPQRGRQEILEAAALPAPSLGNLLRAQGENKGQGSGVGGGHDLKLLAPPDPLRL